MHDVAALAGVGLSTVSRVVNGDVKVSPAKTLAVENAIRELGYRRNDSARHLRTGAAASIGLLIESIADPFFSLISQAVEEVALSRDSLLLSASSHQDAARARRMVLAFCSRRVDGLIITPSEDQSIDYLRTELTAGVAMVFIDRPVPGLDVDTVLTDNVGGAMSGVEHLIAHGHRRIACITDRAGLYTSSHRIRGYRNALAAAGIPFDPALVYSADDTTDTLAGPLTSMLDAENPPTALFTANNRSTIGALRVMGSRHNRPALVGFDDFELADALSPGVTVVAQDPLAMGRMAAELLFRRLDRDTSPPQTITLGTRLIARGSGEQRP
ncbi:LacI family transcriptional regulator [Salinibacterium hongtaonis]|nr:LacI family transcriptional regulator [Salinibacterium hongtaonis]